ncbi:helix-turn-helix domain-containing protein [Thermomicrobium sp. 4228-Ro]|uniref:helix-turn-helix domain-containing protein n=1 Tax=Thermomicrobium sp. 4228-Ro TaxID=2993937 RepID=UPI0022491368|nr:helix-turn-helix domain-containing protein [Thermomicrobium sp. 4228-Ro]MCX2727549.1 helix-turn-helix domain-containing protein [Thermomicrobium sp. 4228-Ro]
MQRTQTPQATQNDRWLTIDEAARLLGVGQSTLRRWSDAGLVPVYRTAGGHRRYREADLLAVLRSETRPRRRLSRKALTDLSYSLYQSQLIHQVTTRPWYRRYRPEHLAELRALGKQLVDLAFRIVNRAVDRTSLIEAGRAIGRRYGELSAAAGLSPAEAVEAFLAFRAPTYIAIAQFAEREEIPTRRVVRLLSELTMMLDEVLLATMQALTGPVESVQETMGYVRNRVTSERPS